MLEKFDINLFLVQTGFILLAFVAVFFLVKFIRKFLSKK